MKFLKPILFLTILFSLSAYTSPEEGSTIVFAGDSITDGAWGGSNGTRVPTAKRNQKDLNHIYGHTYMMLCAARLSADNPEQGLRFYNRGISGNTLADLEARWSDDVLALNPDIISILIGTNDIHLFLNSEQTTPFDFAGWETRFRNLLDQTLEANPETRFIIGTPFTAPTGTVGNNENYKERESLLKHMVEVIETIANEYNGSLIRYDKLFESLFEEYPDVAPDYWIWDGIHPTPAGHQAMADAWLEEYYRMQQN